MAGEFAKAKNVSLFFVHPSKVKTPDNAEVTTAYGLSTSAILGTIVTATDQAGKQRRSLTNALGQLVRVDEPDDAGNLGTVDAPTQATSYSYDTLNNLTTVNQGVQTRTFAYDSLSRLKQATNPESGTIAYAYDAGGNLTQKTDARNVVTTYLYDNLNRVTNRSYSDGTPNVSYTYDDSAIQYAKGKLTKVSSSVSETKYNSFDNLGRVLTSQQITDGNTYNFGYAYNLAGMLTEETYPSGRKVKNTFQTDGDLAKVETQSSGGAYATRADNFSYTSAGAVSSMMLGNSKWENAQFNSRLQPTQLGLGASATDQSLWKVNYDYGTTDNNGNVKAQTISVPNINPLVQTYTYDSLNRIKSAVETQNSGETWKQTFTYDRYGNRNFDAANTTTLGSCPTAECNPTIDAANNRFTTNQGYTYDLSGNLLTDAQNRRFVYDAENKQISVSNDNNSLGQYFYDGYGKRVKKISADETTLFIYDALGKLTGEYLLTNSTPSFSQTSYLTNDMLDSPRVVTDVNGITTSRRDFMPFGEDITNLGGRTGSLGYQTDGVRQNFTGQIKDSELDLDFFQARYYSSKLGRFLSADPENAGADIITPQSWNAYTYALNNPLKYSDPLGKSAECALNGKSIGCDEFLKRFVAGEFDTASGSVNGVVFMITKDKYYDEIEVPDTENGTMRIETRFNRNAFERQIQTVLGALRSVGFLDQDNQLVNTFSFGGGGDFVGSGSGGSWEKAPTYYLERKLFNSGKHGLNWKEGPARAKRDNKSQGKFGSKKDLDYVLQKAQELAPGNFGEFPLPPDNDSIVYTRDGRIVKATKVFIQVKSNGKVHAYPKE